MVADLDTAFILAAGLGERLKPLTDTTPKPLLPIGNTTLIENNLNYLKRAGVKRVVINVWHLGDKIISKLGDGREYGLEITYSKEKELLGTGGGLKNAYSLIGRGSFFLMNSDIVTDLDLNKLAASVREGSAACLAVRRMADGENHTGIDVEGGRVRSIGEGPYNYMGVSVVTKALVDALPNRYPSCLTRDGLLPLLKSERRIDAYVHDGKWCDAGTMKDYESAKVLFKDQ